MKNLILTTAIFTLIGCGTQATSISGGSDEHDGYIKDYTPPEGYYNEATRTMVKESHEFYYKKTGEDASLGCMYDIIWYDGSETKDCIVQYCAVTSIPRVCNSPRE